MYVVYCQNKPKSEHIVSEYIETYFEVSKPLYFSFIVALKVLFSLFLQTPFWLLTGSPAAAGSQAAAQRSAHQTCSENHEVSAAAEGLLFHLTVCLHARHCYMLT